MSNNEILSVLTELQEMSRIIDEAEKRKKQLQETIKAHMGNETELILGPFKVTYKEVIKFVADSALMKKEGIFDKYSKKQVSRPLYVR